MRWRRHRIILGASFTVLSTYLFTGSSGATSLEPDETVRASVSTTGAEADARSWEPVISRSGRFVAFTSNARNLTDGEEVESAVYVRDRDVDGDGVFDEIAAVATTRVSGGGGGGLMYPAISGNGRFIAYSSYVFVEGDANHTYMHLVDRDIDQDGVFDEPAARFDRIVFDGTDCDCGPFRSVLDGSGRSLAYEDPRDYGISVWDRARGKRIRLSVTTRGRRGHGSLGAISLNGRFVTYSTFEADHVRGDRNRALDVFIRDRDADRDGIFDERGTGRTRRVSLSTRGNEANRASFGGAISAAGRHVVFSSAATNLVPADRNRAIDVFVRDRDVDRDGIFDEPGTSRTRRVSLSTGGRPGNGASRAGSVSPDGRYVAFVSDASNLAPGDTNGTADVFVRDRDVDDDGIFDEPRAVRTVLVSRGTSGQSGNGRSDEADPDWVLEFHRLGFPDHPAMGGQSVAFTSVASNLVEGDANSVPDVFVHTLPR